jgi:crotonobetaine/carnitine-CoA ligase
MTRTIPEVLLDAAERDAGGVWLRTDDTRLTFGAAVDAVAVAAARLSSAGVRRGDIVMLTARNSPGYLLTLLGVWSLGAIAVPINPASASAELAGIIEQTRPRAVVSDQELEALVRAELSARAVTAAILDVADVASAQGEPRVATLQPVARPHDVAVLIPTSGTTGRSKLVMQTHRAYVMSGEGFPHWMDLTADDVLMTSLPLFHLNAPAYSVMGSLACGAGLVLLPRFSPSGFIDAARRHGATEFNAIGAMLEMLMRQDERPDDADNPLRLCYTGPAPTRERQEQMERRFGLRIVCGYGMSESPYGLIWRRGTRPFGTLGSVRQHPSLGTVNEARVVDDDGNDVAVSATGELLLRNPTVTPGYWGMPEETSAAIVDGWLHTGDLVIPNDDATYTFVARRKEVIRRRGENLSPLEVEEVIDTNPDVLECAVVGVPSELSEEEVKAFVVPADGRSPDIADLYDHAAERLSPFKVPRYWQLIDALPRTPTGRVAKHSLPAAHGEGEVDMAAAVASRRGSAS